MQTDAVSQRITTAAHSNNRQVARPSIIVRDQRIRAWSRAATGGLAYAYAFAICTNAAGEVVRARTLSDGTLDVRYATPGTTITWSANTVAITSKAGYGVTLSGNGTDNLECYYLHTDGVTVKRIVSTDGGHTWATAATVTTLSAQPTNSIVYLASPAANLVFIGDNSSGVTTIQVAIYSGGAWTVPPWDLAGIATNGPVNVYGVGQVTVPFDVIAIGANDYLVAFYTKSPRGYQDAGLYTVRVSNLGAGLTPHWQQIAPLFATNPGLAQIDTVTYPALYLAFPQLQQVGSEYWLTALEISGYVGTNVQTLVTFRSLDGVHWTDRADKFYAATTLLTYDAGGTPTSFTFNNLANGQLVVSGTNVYLFGFDQALYAAASQLCGVDNAAKKLDVSADVLTWDASLPSGGGAGTFNFTLLNPAGVYNNSTILRRGSKVTIQAGYYTASGEEVTNVVTGLIDEVRQSTAVNAGGEIVNSIEVACRDDTKKLQEDGWVPDIFYEYPGPDATHLTQVSDLTALSVFNGTFFAAGGELHGGMLDSTSTLVDNLATLSYPKGADGLFEMQFKCLGAWTSSYVGVALQIANNADYHAVIYDGTNFSLYKATPNAAGASKIFAYALVASIGGQTRQTAAALTVGTAYWLRVAQWHHRVLAWYSTDRQNWTKVIDYAPVPASISYWGVILKGNVSVSPALGVPQQPADAGLSSLLYTTALNDPNPANLGKAMSHFMRVRTGAAGLLRSITVGLTRYGYGANDALYLPDVTVQLWKDYGDGTKPADLSNSANKLYEYTLSPTTIPPLNNGRVSPLSLPVNSAVNLGSNTYYWICAKSAANITTSGGQMLAVPVYLAYMPPGYGSGLSCVFQYNPADLANFYAFAPNPGGAGSAYSMYLLDSYDSSGIVIQQLNHVGGEVPRTLEFVAQDIAAKAGITAFNPDAWLSDAFGAALDTGADGTAHTWNNAPTGTWATGAGVLTGFHASATTWAYLRTNTYLGNKGDVYLSANLTILATAQRAGFLLRANGAPDSFTAAYLVDLKPGSPDLITLSKIVSGTLTTLYATPSLVALPVGQSMRVTLIANAGMVALYVDDNLAAAFWDATITAQGGVGLAVYGNISGGAVAQFDNVRVPDAWPLKKYFAIQARENGKAALDRLIAQDRLVYFMQPSGALRLASFSSRASVDTYGATVTATKRIDSDRFWVSHIQPQGGRFADRFDATLMDSDGRRFKALDFSDAFTDEQAYDDAAVPLRKAKELTLQYTLESAAMPAVEREDVITAVNALDGTNTAFVVSDVGFRFALSRDQVEFDQTLGLRTFVPGYLPFV